MKIWKGQIDLNDLEYIRNLRGGEMPIAARPCPVKKGIIHPTTTRFYWKNGQIMDIVHIKPIYYYNISNEWRPLSEIASYYGNKKGMVLKSGWENKIHFSYLVWYLRQRPIMLEYPITYLGKKIDSFKHPLVMNPTDTFFPAVGSNAPVDGRVQRGPVNETFGTIRGGAGSSASDVDTDSNACVLEATTTSNQYDNLQRAIYGFDTSSIPDANTIDSATFSLRGSGKNTGLGDTNVDMVTASPASASTLAAADYGNLGTVLQATGIAISANWSTGAYNDFTLNSTGLSNISKTGNTFFGTRLKWDTDNSFTGAWCSTCFTQATARFADFAGTDQDPKLAVTHSAAGGRAGDLLILGVGA